MKQLYYLITLSFFICLLCAGCKDDLNPQEAIVGKWQLVGEGISGSEIQPVDTDGSYIEYFSNGKMVIYNFLSKESIEHTYRIDSKFLYHDGNWSCNYSFGKEKLTLTNIRGPEYSGTYIFTFIYRRKK